MDDFYQALAFPNAFDWQRMPFQWQEAQRSLAVEYRRLQFEMQKAQLDKKLI